MSKKEVKKVSGPQSVNHPLRGVDDPTEGNITGGLSTIQMYLSGLHASLDTLTASTKSLCDKLAPVSLIEPKIDEVADKIPVMSEIAIQILDATMRVKSIIHSLNDAESRIQL